MVTTGSTHSLQYCRDTSSSSRMHVIIILIEYFDSEMSNRVV